MFQVQIGLKNYTWILEHTQCQIKKLVRNKGQSDNGQGVIGE
jgi:hypothetical protein